MHGVELIDISIDKVCKYYENCYNDYNYEFDYDQKEIDKALRLHKAISKIKDEYNLDGLTIRCFDLLSKINTTS